MSATLQSADSRQRLLAFINTSGSTIPPFGVFRIQSRSVSGELVYQAKAPNGDSEVGDIAVNGNVEVVNGDNGNCTMDFPTRMAYTGANPLVNGTMGTKTNQFKLDAGESGIKVLDVDTTKKLIAILNSPTEFQCNTERSH